MGQIFQKIRDFYHKHSYLGYFFVAFFGLALFSAIQATGTFMDPDSFYHAKIAILMLKGGIVHDFSWLTFTVLPQIYTDHHLLYHALLIPFVWKIDPLVGVKIAATLINTLFVVIFYLFLRKNNARWPFLFVFLLLSSTPFIFRINLPKAQGISLIFLLLILLAIFKKKNIWTAILSFFYVWAYAGWPLGIVVSAIYCASSFVAHRIMNGKRLAFEWKPFIFASAGALAGLVINPYFPQNIKFYWIQTVQIALVNYQTKIGVGAEWYGYNVIELITYSGGIFLILGFSLLLFFGNIAIRKKVVVTYEAIRDIFFFLICAGLFFVLTIKSNRNVEYSFPFMLLLAAFIIKYFYNDDVAEWIRKNLRKVFGLRILYKGFFIYLAVMVISGFAFNFWKIKKGFEDGFEFYKYQEATAVMQKNSQSGDVIFHSDWDDWPMLFYHDDYNRYIVGLDATFMYKYNKDLYKKWRDITWGDFTGDAYPVIKNDFNAKLIFIAPTDIEAMDKYFKNDRRYELIYNGDGKAYKIK